MKQSPFLQLVQERMRPGFMTLAGFLGSDTRPLAEILEDDQNTVNSLGLTHEQIAERMEYLTREGKRGLGTTVTVADRFEVRVDDVRGFLSCPWAHIGLHPKTNAYVKNVETGEELTWTALSIHLIREHGFYQGRGSPYRLGPADLKRVLGL